MSLVFRLSRYLWIRRERRLRQMGYDDAEARARIMRRYREARHER